MTTIDSDLTRPQRGSLRTRANNSDASPAQGSALIEMARSYQISQALHVAAMLDVADHLAAGPRSARELAPACGADEDALHRLLRALASRGVFEYGNDGRFALTLISRLMRRDVEGSVRGQLLLWGHPMQWEPWENLLYSVRTGRAAFDRVFGMGHWEYLADNADAEAIFKSAMAAHPSHREIAALYNFAGLEVVVDIGGGVGQLLAAVLRACPHVCGVVLEQPPVAAEARRALADAGLAERSRVIGGDFFSDIPADADAYILSNVLMDWNDRSAWALLSRCREAMGRRARLLIVERMIPPDNAPSISQLSDLMGLVVTGGRIRSAHEFDRLFEATGFRRANAIRTPAGYTILDARPYFGG